MCLEIDYKVVFIVLALCKLHANMYTDLKKNPSVTAALSASLSLRATGKLSAHLASASQSTVPSHTSQHSPLHQVLFLA